MINSLFAVRLIFFFLFPYTLSSHLSYSKLTQRTGGVKDFNYLVDTKSAQKRHFQPGVLLFAFPPLPFVVVVPLQMEVE